MTRRAVRDLCLLLDRLDYSCLLRHTRSCTSPTPIRIRYPTCLALHMASLRSATCSQPPSPSHSHTPHHPLTHPPSPRGCNLAPAYHPMGIFERLSLAPLSPTLLRLANALFHLQPRRSILRPETSPHNSPDGLPVPQPSSCSSRPYWVHCMLRRSDSPRNPPR